MPQEEVRVYQWEHLKALLDMRVGEVALDQIERFEYKAIGWTDERDVGLQKVKFKEK